MTTFALYVDDLSDVNVNETHGNDLLGIRRLVALKTFHIAFKTHFSEEGERGRRRRERRQIRK